MSVNAGPADWWTEGTDTGRKHVATKGVVQTGLIFNVDANILDSYSGSGTAWNDLSSSPKNGTHVNTPTYSSGAFTYNGSTQYSTFPNVICFNPGKTITIEFVSRGTGAVLSNERTADGAHGWGTVDVTAGGALTFNAITINTPPYQYALTTTGTASTTRFNHYVISVSIPATSGTMSGLLAINGNVESKSVAVTVNAGANFTTVDIGRYRNHIFGTVYFTGSVALARIYNVQLTSAQITQNFNAVRARFEL